MRRPEIPIELWRNGEALFGQKMQRLTIKQVVKLAGRDLTKNPATQKIIADKAELRRVIANDLQLVKDFEFFTKLLGWDPEGLLQHLYWDCNMMAANPQTIRARDKQNTWPLERNHLVSLCEDISALALRLEELNKTSFSPGRTVILRTSDGVPLPTAQQRFLLTAFQRMPEILGFYARELHRKIATTEQYWARHEPAFETLSELTRENSLYEKVRQHAGRHHATRLHRLINAARRTVGLSPVSWRAFVVWLGRLKKACGRSRECRDFVREYGPIQVVVRENKAGRNRVSNVIVTPETPNIADLFEKANQFCIAGQTYGREEFEKLPNAPALTEKP